jgi:hypothetical protein
MQTVTTIAGAQYCRCRIQLDAVLSRQFGRASAPMVPRAPNVGTGTSSGQGGNIFASLQG